MSLRSPWVLVEAGKLADSGEFRLEAEESRHLQKVLRRQIGDRVIVTDGAGRTAEARIAAFERSGAILRIGQITSVSRVRGPEILLGILQGKAMDWALQKTVELGVERIVPLKAARSQAAKTAQSRLHHWKRLTRQALKQCHRAWEMDILDPRSIAELVEEDSAPGFVADPKGSSLGRIEQSVSPRVVVGPEGGLDEAEKKLLRDAGWTPLSLGAHVLRAETAVLAGAVLLGACSE